MDITRRELLEMAAMLAVAPPQDEVVRRASDTISDYSAEGDHRTATAVDRASADALLRRVRATGAVVAFETFDLSRVDPGSAFIEIDGRRLDGLPMFDGAFTDAAGVAGAIGPAGGDRPIGWTRIAPNAELALRQLRRDARHQAIVAVTIGGRPGLCPVNAGWFSEPFGPPVLQVSSEHLSILEAASGSDARGRVVCDVSRAPARALNVVAEIRGTDSSLPPVCVMTPRSGWGANASERGGGLVCWLEAIGAARGVRPLRTVSCVASSGHELGHLGLHDYLRRHPTLARGAFAWVHFGANIGSATGDTGLTASDDGLRDATLRAFAPYALDGIRQSPAAQVGGEALTIREQDGRFVSLIGRNDWFHNPRDLWPDTVKVQAVARFARAAADLTLLLANSPA